jgi:hypothetical protein
VLILKGQGVTSTRAVIGVSMYKKDILGFKLSVNGNGDGGKPA